MPRNRDKESRLDIDSPKLEGFLRSEEIRVLDASERLRRIRAIFGSGARVTTRATEELHPYRIMSLWRIARFTMQVKGLLSDDDQLDEATQADPSPWNSPTKPVRPDAARRGHGPLIARHIEGEGLPILCPFVRSTAPKEAPERKVVARWCDAAGIAASLLGIGETETGQWGLQGLLDPTVAPQCCPTSLQILAFEERLVSEAIELLLEYGEGATILHYREEYGMTRSEALSIIKLARRRLREEMEAPVEEKRAVAEAYLKKYIEDVSQTPNMRDRLLAIKELVRVQGVTREAPEDAMRDFVNVVRSVGEKRKQLEEKRYAQIGSGEPTDAAFEVINHDDDPEALADFDRENG